MPSILRWHQWFSDSCGAISLAPPCRVSGKCMRLTTEWVNPPGGITVMSAKATQAGGSSDRGSRVAIMLARAASGRRPL